ncbi:UPF0764 protein C16orf89-like [Acipenser ruthenus]|uniref:UPF0764 protein C16orf89-like n=1 Tax=Acipenser ruthenus TaxID=7906 RepID=A0A444UPN3_ACIRT|nr:UPF0764 protein C16orf89-like [Acipenser ruthenus]
MCRLGSFPWSEFEGKLKSSDSSPVLQEILKKHEATVTEPMDELYDALAEVLGAEEGKVCHKNYLLPSGDFVSLTESVAVISEGTTGLVTWEAALCLAEWALELPQVFKDRSVLELGSGVGLTGIALCKSCSPKRYTFSDCHPTVLQQLQRNVELNGLALRGSSVADSSSADVGVAVEGLDWAAVSEEQLQDLQADVVIASDVVYDPEIVCCLVGLLSKLLSCTVKDSIPEVYISSTIRNPETYSLFKTELVEVEEALRRWPHTDPWNTPQLSRVKRLVKRLNSVIAQAALTLQESDPTYYREFEPILGADFWTVPHMWNTSNPALVYPAFREVECFDEKLSDRCMTLLLGTWKDNGTPCIVTNSCRNSMTRFGCPDYSLSHQLLYFLFGAMQGCYNILQGERRESRANLTDRDYKTIFCSNMMKRNVEFEKNGFPIQTRDIFMENIMLCGMAGFSDFYKPSWLRRILTWQDSDVGCFGKDEEEESSHRLERNLLETTDLHKRVKRREKTLKGILTKMYFDDRRL